MAEAVLMVVIGLALLGLYGLVQQVRMWWWRRRWGKH
jgi:hypothetical protein